MTENDCVGCIHYRPYSKHEGSNEWECEQGMTIAYECINDGYSKKRKPCPFCKCSQMMSWHIGHFDKPWFVECIKCSASGPHADTEKEANELWNRR